MSAPLKPCQFRDTAGRVWTVDVHPLLLEQLRGDRGRMLLGGIIVQVLYELLADQIEQQGLTPEEFAGGFGGETIEHATSAVMAAVEAMLPETEADTLCDLLSKLDGLSVPDDTGGD